jgi:hypothetical protein
MHGWISARKQHIPSVSWWEKLGDLIRVTIRIVEHKQPFMFDGRKPPKYRLCRRFHSRCLRFWVGGNALETQSHGLSTRRINPKYSPEPKLR